VEGSQNEIRCIESVISSSSIQINGTNNKVYLDSGVKLRGAKINIRGNNNNIFIGRHSTFGGVRIVNVGESNNIKIGENCLFADYIEIWASDTHSIFDENGKVINREKPIEIGDHVWIGSHVIILKGVHIHDGSVIGMGSLVTKDVPSNVISAGRPNIVIKEKVNWTLDYLE
jgi:acetyltransferase-like isoleucine patch superfamily enzyme